jgi:hypothetical protein
MAYLILFDIAKSRDGSQNGELLMNWPKTPCARDPGYAHVPVTPFLLLFFNIPDLFTVVVPVPTKNKVNVV